MNPTVEISLAKLQKLAVKTKDPYVIDVVRNTSIPKENISIGRKWDTIVDIVANECKVPAQAIKSNIDEKDCVEAKYLAYHIANKHYDYPVTLLSVLSGIQHPTVIYGIKKVDKRLTLKSSTLLTKYKKSLKELKYIWKNQ